MINVLQNFVLDGMEKGFFPLTIDENGRQYQASFVTRPEIITKENIKNAQHTAFVVKDEITICNAYAFTLLKDVSYKISGTYTNAPQNAKVYVSLYNRNKSLKQSIIATTSVTEDSFSFSDEYLYNEDTIIVVWIKIKGKLEELNCFKPEAFALNAPNDFIYELKDNLSIPESVVNAMNYCKYNSKVYRDIDTVWIDKNSYPQAIIGYNSNGQVFLLCGQGFYYNDNSLGIEANGKNRLYRYETTEWILEQDNDFSENTLVVNMDKLVITSSEKSGLMWSNDIINNLSETDYGSYVSLPLTSDQIIQYTVRVDGTYPKREGAPSTINLLKLYFDSSAELPDYQASDDYTLENKEKLINNVNRGLYDLENGNMVPSNTDRNFGIFYSSLVALNNASKIYEVEDTNSYDLSASWGKRYDSNRVLIWMIAPLDSQKDLLINEVSWQGYPPASDSNPGGGGDEPVCLSGDTLITMADFSQKRLDKITDQDYVLGTNKQPNKVLYIKHNFYSSYHTLYYFDDGTIIDETHEHRFYNQTQGFWQRLKHWNIGDLAVKINGETTKLIKKEKKNEEIENFGIFTEDGTYYANGLLSGAARCNRDLLKNASVNQAIDMVLSIDEKKLVSLLGVEEVLL